MFGWLLGRAMCLLEVGTDGVGAPGKPKKKKKKGGRKEMYIMKMSLRIQERITWPGFISRWVSTYRACTQAKELVLIQGW